MQQLNFIHKNKMEDWENQGDWDDQGPIQDLKQSIDLYDEISDKLSVYNDVENYDLDNARHREIYDENKKRAVELTKEYIEAGNLVCATYDNLPVSLPSGFDQGIRLMIEEIRRKNEVLEDLLREMGEIG